MQTANSPKIPALWIWIAPLIIAHVGTRISMLFQTAPGIAAVYLPIPLGLVMMIWWGPRALLGVYLNAAFSAGLWTLSKTHLFPLYALPETIAILIGWYSFIIVSNGKCWLPSLDHLARFLLLAVLPAALVNGLLVPAVLITSGELTNTGLVGQIFNGLIGTSLDYLSVAVPLLFFLTPVLSRRGWILQRDVPRPEAVLAERRSRLAHLEIVTLFSAVLILSLRLSLDENWFLYAVFALWMGLRFGVGMAVLANAWVHLLLLYLPVLWHNYINTTAIPFPAITANLYMSVIIAAASALLVGRAISDLYEEMRERHKAEQARREAEILRLELDKERELRELRQRFISMLIHDFRNPLSALQLSLGLLHRYWERTDPERGRQRIDDMTVHINRLNALLEDVLVISKMEGVEMHLRRESVMLDKFCRSIFDEMQAGDNTHVLVYASDTKDTNCFIDPELMRRALTNLLHNALKYSPSSTTVQFVVSVDGDEIALSVSDQGIGIPLTDLEHLYDPFFRASNVGDISGTGLGLPIVKQIIDLHGGSITVISEAGRGTTFTIRLPANMALSVSAKDYAG